MKKVTMKKSDTIVNKKIIILTSSGGGGHLSASSALETYLCSDYEPESVHVFKLLQHLDPILMLTDNKYSCEELFNVLLPKKYARSLNWIYRLGSRYIQWRKKDIHKKLRHHFIEQNPALIISVVPILNNIVLEVAQELRIPFLLIPTDLNISMYIMHIMNPTYKQFYIGLAFNDKDIMKYIKKNRISNDHITILGPPLKADFFIHKNKDLLKQEYLIVEHKPVIMILMGSQGSNETEKYTKQLLTLSFPVHLLVCIGKNIKSKNSLAKLSIPAHISISIIDFTPHIADYMTMADILISKSGTQSVCEALYTNIPLFLDATSTTLPWEQFNHTFIKKHHFGELIKKYKQIVPLVTSLIQDSQKLTFYKHNIKKLEKKVFTKELLLLLEKIVSN